MADSCPRCKKIDNVAMKTREGDLIMQNTDDQLYMENTLREELKYLIHKHGYARILHLLANHMLEGTKNINCQTSPLYQEQVFADLETDIYHAAVKAYDMHI